METWEVIIRLVLAAVLGALIGVERESLSRPAGLKTYTLVCVGSALVMIVSIEMFVEYKHWANVDPGRIAAQVVSGIGFLGAGTILREGASIKGLTTAAGLWVVACIGLAAGAGMYTASIISTILILLVLVYFYKAQDIFTGLRVYKGIVITVDDRPGQIGIIGSILGSMDVHIKNINLNSQEDTGRLEVELLMDVPPETSMNHVVEQLSKMSGFYGLDRLN